MNGPIEKKDGPITYSLMQREDLFCLNCGIPSIHHRLHANSIDAIKSGNDWHLTVKGKPVALIPQHVIEKVFGSLPQGEVELMVLGKKGPNYIEIEN